MSSLSFNFLYIYLQSVIKCLKKLLLSLFLQITHIRRTITRGVNRGAREELMSAVERQIKRFEEPIEPLLRLIFLNKKNTSRKKNYSLAVIVHHSCIM